MKFLSDRLPGWLAIPTVWAAITTGASGIMVFATIWFTLGSPIPAFAFAVAIAFLALVTFYYEIRSRQIRETPHLVALRRQAYQLAQQGFETGQYSLRAVGGDVVMSIQPVGRSSMMMSRFSASVLSAPTGALNADDVTSLRGQAVLIRKGFDGIYSVAYPARITAVETSASRHHRTFTVVLPGATGPRRSSYRQMLLVAKATVFDEENEFKTLIEQLEAFLQYS